MWPHQQRRDSDLKTSVVAMASYLRHSFTLPNRKKAKYRSDIFDPKPDPLSKSELTLFTSESEGSQYYAVDRLEDVYASATKFPDFYGGYPLEEVESLPRSRLNSTSDYGSELESPSAALAPTKISAFDSATASIYATLRTPRKRSSSAATAQTTTTTVPSAVKPTITLKASSASLPTEEFHCCCRNSCHTGGGNGGYRMNMHCCKVMEPLWESDSAMVPLRNKTKTGSGMEWYDRRTRHRSCPSFHQVRSTSLTFFFSFDIDYTVWVEPPNVKACDL